jgi:hypothetical protein
VHKNGAGNGAVSVFQLCAASASSEQIGLALIDVRLEPKSGARADIPEPPLRAESSRMARRISHVLDARSRLGRLSSSRL